MKFRAVFWLVIISIASVGCASTQNYEKILSSWVGVNADELAWVWGPPSYVYPLSSGDKLLTYMSSATTNSYTAVSPNLAITSTYTTTQYCKTFFLTDKSNVISGWHWQGSDCKIDVPHDNKAFPTNGWSQPKISQK
jgi:hypothetical protein